VVEWREVESSAQPLHLQSEYGNSLYIQDTHRGRLETNGDQYHLVYANAGEYTSVLTGSNDLPGLRELVGEILDIEEDVSKGGYTD